MPMGRGGRDHQAGLTLRRVGPATRVTHFRRELAWGGIRTGEMEERSCIRGHPRSSVSKATET